MEEQGRENKKYLKNRSIIKVPNHFQYLVNVLTETPDFYTISVGVKLLPLPYLDDTAVTYTKHMKTLTTPAVYIDWLEL